MSGPPIIYVRPRPETLAAMKHDGTLTSANLIAAWVGGNVARGSTNGSWLVRFYTPMDKVVARPGDHVVEGSPGQFSVVPPDLFQQKWETV